MLLEEAVVSLASSATQGSESAFAPKWELGGEDRNEVNPGTRRGEKCGGSTRRGGGLCGQKARGARWALSRLHFPEVTLPATERCGGGQAQRGPGQEQNWIFPVLGLPTPRRQFTAAAL